jgi:hypothetical protein
VEADPSVRFRLVNVIVGGAGILALGAAAGLHSWNDGRQDDWSRVDEELLAARDSDVSATQATERNQQQHANNLLLDSIRRYEAVSIGLGVAGSAALLGAVYLTVKGSGSDGTTLAWHVDRILLQGHW